MFGEPFVQHSDADSAGVTHGGSRRRRITAAVLPPLAAFLVVVLSVSVSGALGTRGSGSAGSSNVPTTEALVTNVVGLAAQDPNVVMFRAHSRAATYWQVAVLTRQVAGTWEASPGLARALAGRKPASGGDGSDASIETPSNVTADVTIASYQGRVLPVPLGTSAVQGPRPTQSVDDAIVQQGPTTPGEQYVTRGSGSAVGQEDIPSAPADHAASAPTAGPAPASSASIPAEVQLMARRVAAGSDDQAEMVQRIVNWFRSGRFQYSTAAQPPSPRGTAPVVAFLTRTKVGNCQTFTDAFAMMAQSLGIPVRVAVGFTSGAREPSGETVVTGADAHTWPEVFGGPDSGWESVEPTPASSITAIVPSNVRGVGPVPTSTPVRASDTDAHLGGHSNESENFARTHVGYSDSASRSARETVGRRYGRQGSPCSGFSSPASSWEELSSPWSLWSAGRPSGATWDRVRPSSKRGGHRIGRSPGWASAALAAEPLSTMPTDSARRSSDRLTPGGSSRSQMESASNSW